MTKDNKKWGGARPGAGRKPADPKDKRVQMVVTLSRETRDRLKAKAKEQNTNVGRLIDDMFDKSE